MPRKSTVSVYYNGTDIKSALAEYLNSFSYTDVASGESDSISIAINDRDRKWIDQWLPSKGDSLSAIINLENWCNDGDSQKIDCGSFTIDDFGFSGTPVRLKLQAVAIPANSGFRTTERSKVYEKATLEDIARDVAGRAGVSLHYEAVRLLIEKVEQSEKDDCSFLNDLVKQYGFAMKIYKDKIVIFSEDAYEKAEPVATLTEADIEPSWQWNTTLDQTYTGARYEYTNSEKDMTITYQIGGGDRILKVTDPANTQAEAQRITLAKLKESNKNDTTMSLTLSLANKNIIATSCIEIKGLGKLDGKYYVDKSDWDVGTGCRQKLSVRKVIPFSFTPEPEPPVPATKYTVVRGDTLWAIAKKFYGNGSTWKKIYDSNVDVIESTAKKQGNKSSDQGHWIYPGCELVIP